MSINRCVVALLAFMLPSLTFAQTFVPQPCLDDHQAAGTLKSAVPHWFSSGLVKIPLIALDQPACPPSLTPGNSWTVEVQSVDENGNRQSQRVEM